MDGANAQQDAAETLQARQLSEVYGTNPEDLDIAKQRYRGIAEDFQERYKCAPAVFARAPGRVNVIGEHIDYEGYGVLPMAIARDVVVAIATHDSDPAIEVSNFAESENKEYRAFKFRNNPDADVDTENHVWANYALAAYKGVHEYLAEHPEAQTATFKANPGLKILVHGTVPEGSGLSSSSALVVAVSIAILGAYGAHATVPLPDIAKFTCVCERHVGVQSGGMDQAISVMGKLGQAAYIEFDPVRATHVSLPADAAFVVGHSCAAANKAEGAAGKYNLRVVECRLAAVMLALALEVPKETALSYTTLKEVEDIVPLYYIKPPSSSGEGSTPAQRQAAAATAQLPEPIKRLDDCAEAARSLLKAEPYTGDEIKASIGKDAIELFPDMPGAQASMRHAEAHNGGFALQARAVHVFEEAARVLRFRAVCASEEDDSVKMHMLGGLMRHSHDSCRDNYDCSCAELEDVVACGKRAKAYGSRLTGAGWGGSTVHLLPRAEVPAFVDTMRRDFYARKLNVRDRDIETFDSSSWLFASTPAAGAAILDVQQVLSAPAEVPLQQQEQPAMA